MILCIFIYWGWDSCLAVTEETKDAENTPGKAALVSTVILLVHVRAGGGIRAGVRRLRRHRRRADQRGQHRRRPVRAGRAGHGRRPGLAAAADDLDLGASSTQTTILPTARGTLAMAVYGALPKAFARVHPKYHTPSFSTLVMGATAIFFYVRAVVPDPERACRLDRVARPRRRVLLRRHRLQLRLVLPPHDVHVGAALLPARPAPAARLDRDDVGVRQERERHDRTRTTATRCSARGRRVRDRRRHARARACR